MPEPRHSGKKSICNKKTNKHGPPAPGTKTLTYVRHDTSTQKHRPSHPSPNQPTHPPCATAVQHYALQQKDALVRTRTSPEQAGIAENNKMPYQKRKKKHRTASHRHESTHPRAKRPAHFPTHRTPTHPFTHRPTRPPAKPNNPTAMCYSSTAIRTAANRYVRSVLALRFNYFTILRHAGERASRPREGDFPRPPLAEGGVGVRSFAGDIEG